MSFKGIRRAALALTTAAMAGGIALTGAGSAAAATGGGCDGPGWQQVCVSDGGGQVKAEARFYWQPGTGYTYQTSPDLHF
ncbi:hypothetical protein [Kitasatospora sp. CB01950]|uniref:hypothetical protein n=1 Tax=Kitasatospora sp. CB01950 TaxID=1703930 RepID=UPI0011612132|nr:hypothetical protein [Kitasatospora sp. CB01950]